MNELEALAEKEQQEKIQKQQEEQRQTQVKQQFLNIDRQNITRDPLQRSAFKDKALEFQRSYDASLTKDMNEQAQHVAVNAGPADDAGPVPAPAAEETRKERRDRVKREKKAAFEIHELAKTSTLSISPEMVSELRTRQYDDRALASYCKCIHLDKNDRPATPEDEENLRRNQIFVKEFTTGTQEEHNRCLMSITNEFRSIKIDPHIFDDPKKVVENAGKLKEMAARLTGFEDIMKRDKAYFDALDPEIRAELNKKLDMLDMFTPTLTAVLEMNNVNVASGKYTGDDKSADAEEHKDFELNNFRIYGSQFKKDCLTYNVEQEAQKHYSRDVIAERREYYQEKYGEFLEKGAGDYQYEKLKRIRDLIAANPEKYAENKEQIDELYQVFYHAIETAGETMNQSNLYEAVVSDYSEKTEPNDVEFRKMADRLAMNKSDESMALDNYASSLGELLRSLLSDREMTPEAKTILDNYYEEKRKAHWTAYADGKRDAPQDDGQAPA